MFRVPFVAAALVCMCCVTAVWAGTCTIDGNNKHQVIDGFGFSSAWSGTLSDARNKALYNTLGMTILRVRIDESGWFNDETNNANAAHAYGAIVLGSSWTPPTSLRSLVAGTSDQYWLEPKNYAAFASFLAKAGDSLKLDYISFVNEPDVNGGSKWNGDQIHDFLKGYGSQLNKKIAFPEACNFQDKYSDPTLNDAAVVNTVSVVAGHIYGMGIYKHTNALSKGKHVWQTEYYVNNAGDGINECIEVAMSINDCMNAEFSAYLWWWVTDSDNNIKLVDNTGRIYLSGHVFGQFARFIRPGYVRIDSTYNPSTNVYVTAYVGPKNELVIVAVNKGGSSVSQTFTLQNLGALSSLHLYRSSSNERMADVGTVSVSGTTVTINLPAQSVTTATSTTADSPTCASSANEGDSVTVRCPVAGQVINSVDFASYGTPTGSCFTGFTKSSCNSNTSMSVVQSKCIGQASCTVAGSNDVFGDPCFGVGKHLAVKVSCVTPPATDTLCGTANEGASVAVGCAAGKRITKVNFASYGLPQGACTNPATGTCHASTSQSVVETACLNSLSCSVAASNDLFGDPCSGVGKQLTVAITCA